jgi:hypothetical protein
MIPLGLSNYETDAHHLGEEGRRGHLDRNGRLYVGGRAVRSVEVLVRVRGLGLAKTGPSWNASTALLL